MERQLDSDRSDIMGNSFVRTIGLVVGSAISLVFRAVDPLDEFVGRSLVILDGFSGTMLKGEASLRSEHGYPTLRVLGFVLVDVVTVVLAEVILAVTVPTSVQEGLAIIVVAAVAA